MLPFGPCGGCFRPGAALPRSAAATITLATGDIDMSARVSHQFSALIARMRSATSRQAAALLQTLATWRARRRLTRSGPIDVLIDTSVLAFAVAHESIWVSTGVQRWGNITVPTGYLARVPVRKRPVRSAPGHEIRDFEDACYLTGIAHLARLGLIRLRSSGELEAEQWRQPAGMTKGYTLFARGMFEGVDITPVDGMPDMVVGAKWMTLPTLEEQQRERLSRSRDPLYTGLLKRLGPKSSQDAWHIRTADAHGMCCFLTTDHALIRNLRAQERHEPICSLRTKVLTPAELGKLLRLLPMDPRRVSHDGASFPVRADLHMPGSRRPRSRRGGSP